MLASEVAAKLRRVEGMCQGAAPHLPCWGRANELRANLLFRARSGDPVARQAILDLLDTPHPSPLPR